MHIIENTSARTTYYYREQDGAAYFLPAEARPVVRLCTGPVRERLLAVNETA